jgi:sugar phosphate isomerase/epimerase
MGKIGLQLYSVRDAAGKDFLGTLERVGKMGYDGVQFAGFYNTPAKELKAVMDNNGISAAGSHMGIDTLTGDNLKETLEYNNEIGNDLILCPYLPDELRKTADDYRKVADVLNEIGQTCKDNGFTFGYHNHAFEFDAVDGEKGFDLIFENTDPELVKVELDCYWVTYAGLDPRNIIEKYGSRVVSLHIKDMKEEGGQKRSIEIGSGSLDISGLLEVGNQYGTKWFIVEQEQFDGDPMESSVVNIRNLKPLVTK